MKSIKILSLLLSFAVLFVACDNNDEGPAGPEPREQVGRTVLVYIVGDNGVSELSSLFATNFRDMKAGMEEVDYSKCNLVVYSELVNDVPHLISLKKKNGVVVADTLATYPEQNPLNKEVMSSVIAETIHYFPADSYGLVFLSHSSSWTPSSNDPNSRSIGYYRRTQMNIPDFRDVLLSSFPKPLKFILFDSCNMQSVEVAYELRNCAEYFIGSPTEIPGPGAPYNKVVPELFTETDLALNIASAYFNYYEVSYTGVVPTTNENWTGGVATSVIKSAALDELATVTRLILPQYIKDQKLEQSQNYINTKEILQYDFNSHANFDFDNLIQYLTGGTDNDDYLIWKHAFDKAVIYRQTTPLNYSGITWKMFSMEGSEGVSTYIPNGSTNSAMNNFYRTLSWYSASGWNETGW